MKRDARASYQTSHVRKTGTIHLKQMRDYCNIEMCRLHLDEIICKSRYPDTFDSLVNDPFFYSF